MNSNNNLSNKVNSESFLSQKSSEMSIGSELGDQSSNNLNSFFNENFEIEASDQNDLDLILSQESMSNGYSLENNLQKTNSHFLEENKKLVSENQKLRNSLNELTKKQKSSIINSLEQKNNDLLIQLQNITAERDELQAKVRDLTINNQKLKELLDKTSLQGHNNDDQINNSNEYLINISTSELEKNNKSITVDKNPEILQALGLVENMISSQSEEITFISMQKFALFELLKKLIESNKELENQLQESIEYASEFEKNHIDLEKKCVELQDKTDIEMDYLLSSIISISTNYLAQKHIPKNSIKRQLKTIFNSLNTKIQTKLTNIQDLTFNNQIIELFRLIMNYFYDIVDDLIKSESRSSSLIFPSIIDNRNSHTPKEIALLGHLENAVKYIQEIAKSSQMTQSEDERSCIIAQVSRIASFINEEIDPQSIKNVASLFNRSNIESQILTFFDFIKKNDDEENSEDLDEEESIVNKKTQNFQVNSEDEEEDNFQSIRKAENKSIEIKDTPIRELYNLFKTVIVVNSIMFDHFDRAAEDIIHLKSELLSIKESKNRFEQQYNSMAERVDDMSSELGRFFFSIQQQQQQKKEKTKMQKSNKNSKSKRRKSVNNNDSSISSSDLASTNENLYADDPFQSVSELIQLYNRLLVQNNNQKQMIKNLKRNVNELTNNNDKNIQIEELENKNLHLQKENNEMKEKFSNMNEVAKENIDLKNEVKEALEKVEALQLQSNKMKEKKKDDEKNINTLAQQLQTAQSRNQQLNSQFNNLKEIALKSANVIKSYKEKEKQLANRIITLENQLSQTEKNETTKQREIDKAKKIQKLQSKRNEETKEKYELQLKDLNNELQSARTKILQMEEEAASSARSKDSLQHDVAKLKLIEKTLEMKLKQQEAHSLSIVNMERGKCESRIMMARSQIEECLNEHQKRLSNIKIQLLQIIKEFFPESYNAAVASSTMIPSISATEITANLLNNVFSRSPNKLNTESEISPPQYQLSSSLNNYFSNPRNDNFSSPHSQQTETLNPKSPIFSFLSPSSQQRQQQQQTRSLSPLQQFSSPSTAFSVVSNTANQVFVNSTFSSRPFASLDKLCDSVEASLDSVRACVSRSDFHNNVSTAQEANKVRAQLGLKSSASILKKFDEMREKIDDLEEENNLYKEKYEKCIIEKRTLEKELRKGEDNKNELRKWELWGQSVFRQINDEVALVSTSKSCSLTNMIDSSSSASSNHLNGSTESVESDQLELNDLLTTGGRKSSPFRIIPLLTNDEIRAALEDSVLASIGHRAMLRKISLLRAQKIIIDIAYQNLFELLKPFFSTSKSKGKSKLSSSSEAQLALRNLRRNYGYFFCFMLNFNVRFNQLNQDPPNSQYSLCSIRHLILICVFIKRIQQYSGFTPLAGGTTLFLSKYSNENDKRSSLTEFDN